MLVAGCAGPGLVPGSSAPSVAPSPTETVAFQTDGPDATASATPLPMPAGFPVHESMEPVVAEGEYVAAWESDALPPRVYDFYLAQLRAAGFVIDLEGPGGEAAIIRFTSPEGIAYQLDITGRSPAEVALGPPHD
jgi:hypothetical protein